MKLPRRIVLQGLGGALIGLPLLEAQEAYAQVSASTPRRFIVFFEHGGTMSGHSGKGKRVSAGGDANHVDGWDPAAFTENLQLGLIHQTTLNGLEPSLLLVQGIDNQAAFAQASDGLGGHTSSNVTALTAALAAQRCVPRNVGIGEPDCWEPANPSIDAVLAQRLKLRHSVPFTSLNLDLPAALPGSYGAPFYSPHPTVAGKTIPTPMDSNPVVVFNRLFPSGGGGSGGPTREQLMEASILDGTKQQLTRFKSRISARDAQTIDAHLTNLRDIERRLEELQTLTCTAPTLAFQSITADKTRQQLQNLGNLTGPLLVDIGLAALRCGLTNVFTMNISDIVCPWTNPTYSADMGHTMGHSSKTTGMTGPESNKGNAWRATMLSNRRWRMSLFARLLNGLKATQEGTGRTMLDNSIALNTSEMGNAGYHTSYNVPVLLAGGKGVLRTGRFVTMNKKAATNPNTDDYDSEQSVHNLHTTILRAFGYDDAHFGSDNSTKRGVLPGVLV